VERELAWRFWYLVIVASGPIAVPPGEPEGSRELPCITMQQVGTDGPPCLEGCVLLEFAFRALAPHEKREGAHIKGYYVHVDTEQILRRNRQPLLSSVRGTIACKSVKDRPQENARTARRIDAPRQSSRCVGTSKGFPSRYSTASKEVGKVAGCVEDTCPALLESIVAMRSP